MVCSHAHGLVLFALVLIYIYFFYVLQILVFRDFHISLHIEVYSEDCRLSGVMEALIPKRHAVNEMQFFSPVSTVI